MKTNKIIFVFLLAGMILTACQSSAEIEVKTGENLNTKTTKDGGIDANGKPIVDHGIPYSSGPTTAPSITPTSAPPVAQAVTTKENIRLTLPLKK